MAERMTMGQKGEEIAFHYLIGKGYKILSRNWRCEHLELDLVAIDNNELVIVEVKTRSSAIYEEPEESISSRKINYLVNAAEAYIQQHNIDLETRFDVISIKWFSESKQLIDHRIRAFDPPVQ